jgi:hypothetical protein
MRTGLGCKVSGNRFCFGVYDSRLGGDAADGGAMYPEDAGDFGASAARGEHYGVLAGFGGGIDGGAEHERSRAAAARGAAGFGSAAANARGGEGRPAAGKHGSAGPPGGRRLQHNLAAEAADIDLDIKAQDRRAGVVPGETGRHGATPHELLGERGVDVEDSVELGRGDVGP